MSKPKLWMTDLPENWRDELFRYMYDEHGVTLLQSDMNEVRRIIIGTDNHIKEANHNHKNQKLIK